MNPLRSFLAIPRLFGRVRFSDIRVSEAWLAEHRAKGFDMARRREVPTDLSTLVSERLHLVLAED